MHQFVQSAIEAAKQGDNDKALEFLKQVLNANPDDVDAWLVLAAVVDNPQRKRQCLKRVLALDPVNQVARDELLEMDRAEMGGTPLFTPESDSVSTDTYKPSSYVKEELPVTKQQIPTVEKNPAKKEKTLVFKYPILWRVVMYVFVALFGCIGLMMFTAKQGIAGLFFLGFAVLMLVGAFSVSPTVEVSREGIRASGMFSSAETGWDEIVKMKSNAMKRRLELTKRNGEVVNVSTQVSGYPRIVEILQKRRPDLFGAAPRPQTQTSAFEPSYDDQPMIGYSSQRSVSTASSFKGARTFKKSFFKQYGSYLIIIPLLLFAIYVALTQPQNRLGAGMAVFFCFVMLVLPLFQISAVKVEPNKLTIETLFEEKSFNAKEIREIKVDTVRGRYGRVTHFVNVITVKGKNYPMDGFPEGDEIIFGILMNWWDAYRNG